MLISKQTNLAMHISQLAISLLVFAMTLSHVVAQSATTTGSGGGASASSSSTIDGSGGNSDPDRDGLTNQEEQTLGTNPNKSNTDGDDLKDGEDAVPLDPAINWKRTSEPRYAFLEIKNWTPGPHGDPIMTNKKGQLLCKRAVWENGEWTRIAGSETIGSGASVTLSNTYDNRPIVLYEATAISIDDAGRISGYATGGTIAGFDSLPLVWSSATNSSPVAHGVPPELKDEPDRDFGTPYLGRNGVITLAGDPKRGNRRFPEASSPRSSQFGGNGRDGTSCGKTYNSENGADTQPWTWLGPDPQSYSVLDSSNTTNPAPFTGSIDFDTDIHTMGTTPPAGPTATAQERPAVNLGGQTLIYNGQKWIRSQSLQYASALSASGTAITTDFGDPAVWRNGKVTKLKDLCTGLTEEGITAFNTIDINDEGVILIRVPAEIPFVDRIALLIPAAVVEVSPKTKDENNNDIAGSEKPNNTKPLTPFVEVDPNINKIAHRELKVLIFRALKDKKVTWTLDALPGATPATVRGEWDDSPTHKDQFEASTAYGANGFRKVSQSSGETTIGADGHTAIRVNVPPIGFNQVRIKMQIEGVSTPIDLIDMEVPGVVIIDPGHGGQDSGAVGRTDSSILEKDLALEYSLSLKQKMIDKFAVEKHGLKIVMTRKTTGEYMENSLRANLAKDKGADVFVSIHFNSGASTARGTETLVRGANNFNEPEDTGLAGLFQASVFGAVQSQDSGAVNRGVKNYAWSESQKKNIPSQWAVLSDTGYGQTADYHPIRGAIIEVEFVSNEAALELIKLSNATGTAIKTRFATDVSTDIYNNINTQP